MIEDNQSSSEEKETILNKSNEENNPHQNYYDNFASLIYLNFILLLLMTFTTAGKTILYEVFKQADYQFLAPTQFICNYLFGPLMLLMVDSLLIKYPFRLLFYFSSFNLTLFLAGGTLVTTCQYSQLTTQFCSRVSIITISILLSFVSGLLQTVYYVSYVAYINSVSNQSNKSFYYGISYSINSSASIFSNILGYFLVKKMTNNEFYLVIVSCSLVLQFFLLFVQDKRNLENIVQERTFKENIKFQFMKIKFELLRQQVKRLFLFLCFAGFMNSVIYLFQPVMVTNSLKSDDGIEQKYFIQFLVSGFGQILGGVISGKLAERFKRVNVAYIAVSFTFVGILFAYFSYSLTNFYFSLVAGFFIGFSDSATSSIGLSILTKEVSHSNHIFAAFNLCQSLGFGIPSLYWLIFNGKNFLFDLVFTMIFTMLALISMFLYSRYMINNEISIKSINN